MTAPISWRAYPHWIVGSVCAGLAAANLVRVGPLVALVAAAVAALAALAEPRAGAVALASTLAVAGLAWGSARLERLDRSVLLPLAGSAERSRVVVTGPARRTRFNLRVPVQVERFGRLALHEPALLELPPGRAPPQGVRLELVATVKLPRREEHGFDERKWLRRHGVHVILHADRSRQVGSRGGLPGVSDSIRAWLSRSVAGRLHGERRGVVVGVVLGDDAGLSEDLRDRFRASGLYHLLAVSGQNVALVAGGVILAAWFLGVSRLVAEVFALFAMTAYVLAVGAQPSVIRAGIAGALGSLAWLAGRQRDRWHFLLLGALALLAWNPYAALDAGFQLSFAAVVAIFVLVPRIERVLEGYPLPDAARSALAVSTACSLATAPIAWLQFHAIPLLAVPANALAAPAVVPLLGLAFGAALTAPLSPALAAALAWLNGWAAAYLAWCARLVGGLAIAQVTSSSAALALAGSAAAAAYACRRWRKRSSVSTC